MTTDALFGTAQGYLNCEAREEGHYVIAALGDEVYENGPFLVSEDIEKVCDRIISWLIVKIPSARSDRLPN